MTAALRWICHTDKHAGLITSAKELVLATRFAGLSISVSKITEKVVDEFCFGNDTKQLDAVGFLNIVKEGFLLFSENWFKPSYNFLERFFWSIL